MPDGAAVAGLLAGGLGVGVVSALTPVLPAEAYVIAVALAEHRALAVAVAVAVAVGQTVGKVAIFSAVRGARGSRWLGRLRGRSGVGATPGGAGPAPGASGVEPAGGSEGTGAAPRSRWRRWHAGARTRLSRASEACLAALSGRWGPAVVLLSAVVGLPPLLAVAFIAGASTMPRRTFVPACLTGRAVRFAVIAAVPEGFRTLFGA